MDNVKAPEKSEMADEKKDDPLLQSEGLDDSPKVVVVLDEHQKENAEEKRDEGIEDQNKEKVGEDGGNDESVPVINYTLESASEELDQFLSSLSSPGGDHGDEDIDGYLQIPQSVGVFLDLVEEKLAKYESGESNIRFALDAEDEEEDALFFQALNRVSELLRSLMAIKSCLDHHGPLINHTGMIQQRAMAFLEQEFRILLEQSPGSSAKEADHCKLPTPHHTDQEQSEKDQREHENPENSEQSDMDYPGFDEKIVLILQRIADGMIKAGYGPECREVFLVARRNTLMRTLKDEGFDKVSIDEVLRMNWDPLEKEIPVWNKTFKDCSNVYFPGEMKLASQVFPTDDHTGLFCIITHCLTIQFLGFAEAVGMAKRSTEKLFKILDIYEILRDNFPVMESLFPVDHWNELKTEVTRARTRLGETAISIFSDLENSIRTDSGKSPVPGGAVHPLTRYTMNYLKYSCEYKNTLEQLFKEHSRIERADSTSRPRDYPNAEDSNNRDQQNGNNQDGEERESPFSCQLMRIMDHLDANLETKSKLYRDISLSCIFMMNNGRYIVQKTKGSPTIHQVMGDTWCRRRSSDLRIYHKNYQRETWGRLLGCLNHEGLMNNGKIVKPNLKERFKSFNSMFDEIHKAQSTWVVNDEQLQSELRVSISAVMIPAYRSFMARFSQFLDPGRQTEKYVKYQPDDIEDLIEKLFDGNASSSTISRRRA